MPKKVFKSPWFISAVITVITLIVFSRVLSADFVMWDDDTIIYRNPNIQGLSLDHLGKMFTDVDSMMRYNPVTLLSWSITYHFWKLNPFWYHLGNWLLHGLNSALVFLVLHKLLMLISANRKEVHLDPWRITISAAIASLLWSLHPLRVEPVAWCTDRTYCQALFFLLLSLLFYLRASETNAGDKHHYLFLIASAVLYIISLLSYAIGMTFFLVLLILDIYIFRKLGGSNGWWKTPTARRTILEKIPFTAAAGAIALITVCVRIASAGVWEKPVSLAKFGMFQRFMQAMYIWAYYIWRQWYPFNLSPVYTTLVSFDPISPLFIGSAILVVCTIIILLLFRHRWPMGLALGICYLVLLIPVLGIFEHPHYSCDRYSLIVSILWSILLAAWLANPKTKPLLRNIAIVLLVMVITGLGVLTFRYTHIWNNSISLFEYVIRILGDDPYSYDPHARFGRVLFQQGRTDDAIGHFKKAIEVKRDNVAAYNDLSIAYSKVGHWGDAIEICKKAIKIQPDFVQSYNNLGKIYILMGRYEEAIKALEEAVKIKPDYAEAYNNLGITFDKLKRYQEAVEFYARAVKSKPDFADAYSNLGYALFLQGKLPQAISQLTKAVALNPESAKMRTRLAHALMADGRVGDAVKQLRILAQSTTDWTALNNLAWILAVYKDTEFYDPSQAIYLAQKACELTDYKNAGTLDTLAAAYAAAGRFPEAVSAVEKALAIAQASPRDKQLADQFKQHLDMYKNGRPCIEAVRK